MKRFSKALLTFMTAGLISPLLGADIDNSYYDLEITVKSSEESPQLSVCSVFDDKEIAFSMRWDDNNESNYRMQEAMHKHGFRGTFYLNDRKLDFKKLCEKGTDLGSHSMTHVQLPHFNANRAFWEMTAIKPIIEARTNKAVNSYCFSYGKYSSMLKKYVAHDVAESLQRAGYIHNMGLRFTEKFLKKKDPVSSINQIVPGDKNPSLAKFEKDLAKILNNPAKLKANPIVSIGIHVWIRSEEGWKNLDAMLAKYSNKANWWYTTQTEYGAYRKMFAIHKLKEISNSNGMIKYKITLPYASDIGSDIPLTLKFNGTASQVMIDGKAVQTTSKDNSTLFNVEAPSFAQSPTLISYTKNEENKTEPQFTDKTAIQPWLVINDDNTLALTVKKSDAAKITSVKVKYILPLMYNNINADRIKKLDSEKTIVKKLVSAGKKYYKDGVPFILCQLDYLNNGKPERAYAATLGKPVIPEQDGFFRDASAVSVLFIHDDNFKSKFLAMSKPKAPQISDIKWYKAKEEERLKMAETAVHVKKRVWHNKKSVKSKKPHYAVDFPFESEKDGELLVKLPQKSFPRNIEAIFINGEEISAKELHHHKVKKGKNRMILVYKFNWQTASYIELPYSIK